jgi:hypothetical protein
MKIQIKDANYTVQKYEDRLVELTEEIVERQKIVYQVPYEELNSIYANLDPNPDIDIALFNENYAYIQSQHNRVCKILSDIKQEYKIWQMFLGEAQILYKKAKNNILANTEEIRALRNKELQEAALQEKIPELVDLVDKLELIVDDMKEDIGIVEIKANLLDKANTNLNRQQKIVEDEIGLGYKVGVRIKVNTEE